MSSLLFDENLSRRLVDAVADIFPRSTHVRMCGLGGATDRAIVDYAQSRDHVLVTRDADFEALPLMSSVFWPTRILRASSLANVAKL